MLSTDLMFSLVLHALILFCILTVLFFQIVAGIAKKGVESLGNSIENTIYLLLFAAGGELDPASKLLLRNLPLERISEYAGAPDGNYLTNNYYIEAIAYVIIAFLASLFIVPGLFLFYSADKAISLFKIVVENIAVFAFVGVFEIAFFLLIATKYMPVSSDELLLAVIKGLQE
jgi:hypothetical protein